MAAPENFPQTPDILIPGPVLPPFEHLSPDEQWEELENFLKQEEFVSRHFNDLTALTTDLVSLEAIGLDAAETDPMNTMTEVWKRCVDPAQPTIGLRAGTFAQQGALLALAAQRLRSEGQNICNVVLLPDPGFARESYNESGYFASRGVLVDINGVAHAGDFPMPLRLDAISAKDKKRIGDKKGRAVYLNDPKIEDMFGNKTRTQERLATTNIRYVEALVTDVPVNDPTLQETLLASMARGEAMVVKPTAESIGKGVIMIDPATMAPQEAIALLSARRQADPLGKYMLERWVRCYPMTHPDTGIPLDWNLRGYLVDGQGVGEFARIGPRGTAINTSRGAMAEAIEWPFALCGLTKGHLLLVRSRLTQLYAQIRQAFPEAAIIGADIIIDENLQPVVIELNGERSGGLSSILRADYGAGHTRIRKAVRLLHKRLFPDQLPPAQASAATPVAASQEEVSEALGWVEIGSAEGEELTKALGVIDRQRGLRGYAKEFFRTVSFITEHDRPTAEEMRSNLHFAVIEAQRRLRQGEADRAYEPLSIWLNTDPTDRSRLYTSSGALLNLLGINHPNKFPGETFMLPAQSPQNAEALGRTLLVSLLLATDANHNALTDHALTHISQKFTALYIQDPATRHAPQPEYLPISSGEQGYVRLALKMLACFTAIGRDDPVALHTELQDCLPEDSRAALITAPLEHYFDKHKPISDIERYNSFLVMVAYGKLVDAYALHKQLPSEYRQEANRTLTSIFNSKIDLDQLKATLEGNRIRQRPRKLLKLLWAALDAVTAEELDVKKANQAVNVIDGVTRGGKYPKLRDLQGLIALHIESRNLSPEPDA